jgi:hypothetical protein
MAIPSFLETPVGFINQIVPTNVTVVPVACRKLDPECNGLAAVFGVLPKGRFGGCVMEILGT